MTNININMESSEVKCWLKSAVVYLKKYGKEHNEDVIPEVSTIQNIINNINE